MNYESCANITHPSLGASCRRSRYISIFYGLHCVPLKKKNRRVRRQENTLTTAWPGTRHLQVFRNPKGQVEITYARLAYISIGYNQMYHYFLYALPVCLSADVWIHTWGYMLQRPYRVYIKVPRGNLWSLTVTRRNHEINHRMYVWRVDSIGWIR